VLQGLAIIFGAVGSHFLFAFHLTPMFVLGALLVIVSSFLYGSSAQTPSELCEALCAAVPDKQGDADVCAEKKLLDPSDTESVDAPDIMSETQKQKTAPTC
jgi:hypothetical protein